MKKLNEDGEEEEAAAAVAEKDSLTWASIAPMKGGGGELFSNN